MQKKKSVFPENRIFSLLFTPSGKNRHEMYVIAHAAKKWSMKKKTVQLCFVLFFVFLSVVVFDRAIRHTSRQTDREGGRIAGKFLVFFIFSQHFQSLPTVTTQ